MNEELKDELDAIEAIYPECLTRVNNEELIDLVVPQHEEYKIRISFPAEYPNEMPHILQVRSKNAGEDVHYLEGLFNEVLESVFVEGSVCLFDFLTELDGVLYVEEETEVVSHSEVDSPGAGETDVDAFKGWTVSEPIVDRNSTFIAFAQRVESESEMNEKLSLLKMNKKISRATHNMTAFRIANADGTKVQDCDDDGETAAGGRLLHLLTVMDAWNVIVVVSRWYGGIHLGPDRFRHINASARDAIVRGDLVDESKKSHKQRHKKKK